MAQISTEREEKPEPRDVSRCRSVGCRPRTGACQPDLPASQEAIHALGRSRWPRARSLVPSASVRLIQIALLSCCSQARGHPGVQIGPHSGRIPAKAAVAARPAPSLEPWVKAMYPHLEAAPSNDDVRSASSNIWPRPPSGRVRRGRRRRTSKYSGIRQTTTIMPRSARPLTNRPRALRRFGSAAFTCVPYRSINLSAKSPLPVPKDPWRLSREWWPSGRRPASSTARSTGP